MEATHAKEDRVFAPLIPNTLPDSEGRSQDPESDERTVGVLKSG